MLLKYKFRLNSSKEQEVRPNQLVESVLVVRVVSELVAHKE